MTLKQIKAHFDGEKVIFPESVLRNLTPGELTVFLGLESDDDDHKAIIKAQEEVAKKIWDNDKDADYDNL